MYGVSGDLFMILGNDIFYLLPETVNPSWGPTVFGKRMLAVLNGIIT